MRIHIIVVPVASSLLFSQTLNGSAVTGWGCNSYGQTSPPAGLDYVQAISAGGYHGLALKQDNTVTGWGYNYYGQASPPAGLSHVKAIAGGYFHSLALKEDNTVVGWGENNYGQA